MSLFNKKKETPAPVTTGSGDYAPLDKQLYDLEAENLNDILGKPVEVYPTKSAVMYTEYADVLLAINFGGLEAAAVEDTTVDVLNADNIEFEDNEFVASQGSKYDDDNEPIVSDDDEVGVADDEPAVISGSAEGTDEDLPIEDTEIPINSDTNQTSPTTNGIKNIEEGEIMPNVDEMMEQEIAAFRGEDIVVSADDPGFDDTEDTEDAEVIDDVEDTEITEEPAEEAEVVGDLDDVKIDTADSEKSDFVLDEGKTEDNQQSGDTSQGKKLVIPDKKISLVKVEEPEDAETVEEAETANNAESKEAVPEFYTSNSKLILLLRKMGILDVMEQLATTEDLDEVELLKATSNIRKLNTAYGDNEALAVTYLESRGIDFRKLVGDTCVNYKAEQILFIGDMVSKGFEPIDAILNPEYTIAQMKCICDLEEQGRINTMAFCTPNFQPSTMKQLAAVYLTGVDMTAFKEFKVLTWHGVALIQTALLAGRTDLSEFRTSDGALDENKLYGYLKDTNFAEDAKTGKLGANGLTYVL